VLNAQTTEFTRFARGDALRCDRDVGLPPSARRVWPRAAQVRMGWLCVTLGTLYYTLYGSQGTHPC